MMSCTTNRKNITGGRIRRLRESLSISQKQLSALMNERGLDIASSTLCKIERGTRSINDIELKYIADIFHVSVESLYADDCSDAEKK